MTATETPTKAELLAALRESGEETVATLRGLSPETLAQGRYEGGWTAREIVAHLAAIEWTYPRLIDLARQAAAHPEGAGDAGTATVSGGIDAYNARQVERRAGASLDELVDEFARNRAATIAAVAGVDDAFLAVPIRSAGGITGTLGAVMRFTAVDHVRGHVRDITGDA